METQFDNESVYSIPDTNKLYYYFKNSRCSGFTYLMKLILMTNKHPELIDMINVYKNEMNEKNFDGWTALMIACLNYNTYSSQDTVKELIKNGANLNIKNNLYCTVLNLICTYHDDIKNNYLPVIKQLISAGADINIKDLYSNTPLIKLVESTFAEKYYAVKELIEAGANLNIMNADKQTALMLICFNSDISKPDI